MRLKTLLTATLLSLSTAAFAQVGQWTYDSVAMGAGYANDVFYELTQGLKTPRSGSDWDIAFQTPVYGYRDVTFNATVRANHSRKNVEVYVINDSASFLWPTLSAADTIGKTSASMQLLNNDSSWAHGALYQNRLPQDPFSYGWGSYRQSDHSINGDIIYLLKVGTTGEAYKLWVQRLVAMPADSIGYTFRIAKLDGTNENTVKFYTKGYSDRLFAYYDVTTNTLLNREPSYKTWDIQFTQYKSIIPGPGGVLMPYTLTGVLTNFYTEVADVRRLNPNEISANTFKSYPRTLRTDEIGADWKTHIGGGVYTTDDSGSFIIKSKATSNYWQVQFTRFDGGSATGMGKIVFRKRYLGTALSVSETAAKNLNAFTVAPNPAGADATLMLDAKKAGTAQMIVTDMAGRVITNASLTLNSGVNAFSLNTAAWPAGNYAIQVAAQDWKVSTRLVVAH